MGAHLYVFAKAPLVGTVKRRLAADIGDVAAWRVYREIMGATVRRLSLDTRWQTRIAVTPDRFAPRGRFWPPCVARIGQGGGGLGQRMALALGRFPGEPAVVVGSDIPDLRPHHVAAAFAALRRADAVFGPSGDGGYWLVGVRGIRRPGDMFAGVRFSTSHALTDTLANLEGRKIAMVERLDDIDDGAALASWREAQTLAKEGNAGQAACAASRTSGLSSMG